MSSGKTTDRTLEGAGQRGLWRLMLKLPALRGRLQILAAREQSLHELFEAYEVTSVTLQRLRSNSGDSISDRATEYAGICSEIESEIIERCLDGYSRVPD